MRIKNHNNFFIGKITVILKKLKYGRISEFFHSAKYSILMSKIFTKISQSIVSHFSVTSYKLAIVNKGDGVEIALGRSGVIKMKEI